MSLWKEHLGLSDAELPSIADPIDALGQPAGRPDWSTSLAISPSRRHHAVCHYVPSEPRRNIGGQLINPETVCP